MSVYNEPIEWVRESMESVLSQSYKNLEFIVINDNPNDKNIIKIIEKYKEKDSRVFFLNNKKNMGGAASRNRGLRRAIGKYVAIMDADDISKKNRFERQINFLEQNKEVFLVGTGVVNINERKKVINTFRPLCNFEKIRRKLKDKNCIYHSTVMFRNSYLFYRKKMNFVEDYDLLLRIITKGKIISNIKEPLVFYRIREGSVSRLNAGKQKLFAEKAKEFYNQRLKFGEDNYDEFNPEEIMNIDINKTRNEVILKYEVLANFKINNFKKARTLALRYFECRGFLNVIIFYYLLSFFPKKIIILLRKIFFNFGRRIFYKVQSFFPI